MSALLAHVFCVVRIIWNETQNKQIIIGGLTRQSRFIGFVLRVDTAMV